MKTEISVDKYFLVKGIFNRLSNSYDSFGNVRPDYYESILLPDLNEKEYKMFVEIMEGNFK